MSVMPRIVVSNAKAAACQGIPLRAIYTTILTIERYKNRSSLVMGVSNRLLGTFATIFSTPAMISLTCPTHHAQIEKSHGITMTTAQAWEPARVFSRVRTTLTELTLII